MKKFVIIIIALIASIFIIRNLSIFNPPVQVKNLPAGIEVDKCKYPITGIDISRHTGMVDFQKIKEQFEDTIDFVYIKASEGGNLADINFKTNYINAIVNDIPVGPYHFFKFNVSGNKQASNFLQTIDNKVFDLPLVLDIEEWSNTSNIQTSKIITEIRRFIRAVEKKRNDKIMIYSNESGYQKYIKGNFESNKIWICSFNPEPKIQDKWTLWQHSHNGKFDGAEGWIDINTFNGSRHEWSQFLSY